MPLSSFRKKEKPFLRGILTLSDSTELSSWSGVNQLKSPSSPASGMAEELLLQMPSACSDHGESLPGRESCSKEPKTRIVEHNRWGFTSRPFPSPAISPFLPQCQENLSWNRLCLKTAGPGLPWWVSNGRKKEGLRVNFPLDFFFFFS